MLISYRDPVSSRAPRLYATLALWLSSAICGWVLIRGGIFYLIAAILPTSVCATHYFSVTRGRETEAPESLERKVPHSTTEGQAESIGHLEVRKVHDPKSGHTVYPDPGPPPQPQHEARRTTAPSTSENTREFVRFDQRKDFRRQHPRLLTSCHPAYRLDQSATGRLFVLAGSAIGASHDQEGEFREDAVSFSVLTPSGFLACALADGLGSTASSHITSDNAARFAVTALSSLGRESLLVDNWPMHVERLLAEINDAFASGESDLRNSRIPDSEISGRSRQGKTTLVGSLVIPGSGTERCAWFSVGDSEIALFDPENGAIRWLTDRAAHGGPMNRTIPGASTPDSCGVIELQAGWCLLMVSDGMADVLEDGWQLTSAALLRARRSLGAIPELAQALDQQVQGAHDDRSLVAVGRTYQS